MGRLFWKFFLFILLAQTAGILSTGVFFWLEHRGQEQRLEFRPGPPPERPAAPEFLPPPGGSHDKRGDRPPPPPPFGIPFGHLLGALCASIIFAAALAWYVAKPIRRLKRGFAAAAQGDFSHRLAPDMGQRRDELSDLGGDFDRMTERLGQLMEAQKRLLHDVSHELRSPLARLQAAIGLARQQPDKLEETLSRLEREGERMNALVGELLTLSRLEAGVKGAVEEIDLDELLAILIDDARFEAASRSIRVELRSAQGIRVHANPELLHRAIENVMRNALRYSPDSGEVSIEVSLTASGCCRISICDQGPGVRESELATIFHPFHRGGGQGDGYGLGLAIAQAVFTAVNGKIRAKNRLQGGLCVDMELPASNRN